MGVWLPLLVRLGTHQSDNHQTGGSISYWILWGHREAGRHLVLSLSVFLFQRTIVVYIPLFIFTKAGLPEEQK